MKGQRLEWTQEHRAFLEATVPGCAWNKVADLFNARFSLSRNRDGIKAYCKRERILNGRDGRIQPGSTPPNKGRRGCSHPGSVATQFKPGTRPHTYKPIGTYQQTTSRVRADARLSGYVVPTYWKVKVADTDQPRHGWKFVHRLVWEGQHGPIPDGHSVIFIDGDTENISADNLECVSRGALAILNRHHNFSDAPVELRRTLIAMAKLNACASDRAAGHVTGPRGERKHLRELAEDYGIKHGTVYARIRVRGWSVTEALLTPLGKKPTRLQGAQHA